MLDFTDPGFLGFMESEGMMDTNEGLIARVAKVLDQSDSPGEEAGRCVRLK